MPYYLDDCAHHLQSVLHDSKAIKFMISLFKLKLKCFICLIKVR